MGSESVACQPKSVGLALGTYVIQNPRILWKAKNEQKVPDSTVLNPFSAYTHSTFVVIIIIILLNSHSQVLFHEGVSAKK